VKEIEAAPRVGGISGKVHSVATGTTENDSATDWKLIHQWAKITASAYSAEDRDVQHNSMSCTTKNDLRNPILPYFLPPT
jgi:hypothetical protein